MERPLQPLGLKDCAAFSDSQDLTVVREGGTYVSALSQEDAHCLQESSEVSDLTLLQAAGFTLSIVLSDFKNLLLSSLEQQNLKTQVGGCTIAAPLPSAEVFVRCQQLH